MPNKEWGYRYEGWQKRKWWGYVINKYLGIWSRSNWFWGQCGINKPINGGMSNQQWRIWMQVNAENAPNQVDEDPNPKSRVPLGQTHRGISWRPKQRDPSNEIRGRRWMSTSKWPGTSSSSLQLHLGLSCLWGSMDSNLDAAVNVTYKDLPPWIRTVIWWKWVFLKS